MHVYSLQVRKVAASVSALLLVGCLQQEAPLTDEKVDAADCSSVSNVSAKNVFCSAHGWRSIATGYSHSSYNGYQQTPATYWTGQKIITWGDMVGEHETNAGEIYDPVTNSWSSFSTANAPRARTNFVSAFTGTELLVWGGMARFANEPFVFNDGGAYNLDTGVWTKISHADAPVGRLAALSVWTGSQLLVWGGQPNYTSEQFADGGIYDRATDSWSPMSAVNAPSPRRYATAVWTGTEMVIWGGIDYSTTSPTPLMTGARYRRAGGTPRANSHEGGRSCRIFS